MADPPAFLNNVGMTGLGVSPNLLDRAVWRGEHEPDDAWVAALDKTDRGDKAALLELLRADPGSLVSRALG